MAQSAAGWGWFIDATPWDDSEFDSWDGIEMRPTNDQGDSGRRDLLSVVMHELGHVLALLSLAIEFDQTWARPKRRVEIITA